MKLNDLLLRISLQSQEIRFAVGLAFGYNGIHVVFSNIACHRSASVITQSSSCQLFIHFSLIEI